MFEEKLLELCQRKSVHEPLQTGIKAIDALVPIGKRAKRACVVI